jgi:peptidoglycan/xylan/chitin deacetylase (PgdA/CDA1 family)
MNKTQTIVTTSWDDGHILDLKLARLLKKYEMPATFYIAPRNHELPEESRLGDKEILEISKHFEIGAHSLSHQHLSQVSPEQADFEIRESKRYLEEVSGKEVVSFSYPHGDYNKRVMKLVEKNGFKLARTVKRYSFVMPANPFKMRTTLQAYNHLSDLPRIARFADFKLSKILHYMSWQNLAIDLFDKALEEKSAFHLWGHSWELEKTQGWNKLEEVLQYIAKRDDVTYATNAEIVL